MGRKEIRIWGEQGERHKKKRSSEANLGKKMDVSLDSYQIIDSVIREVMM